MQNSSQDDTRHLILETARAHLRRFGEDKMTVVDIARALNMSHANVYRFFRNKAEILDAVVDEWLSRVEAFVQEIAARPATASERIEAIVLDIHRRRRGKLLEDAEVYHTFRRLIESRPHAVAIRRDKIFQMIKRLVSEGIENGEFRPVDCQEAAQAIEDASATFLHPHLITAELKGDTENRAKNVLRYILAGMRPG